MWLSLAGRSRKDFMCSRVSVHLLCMLLDEFVSLRRLFSQDLLLFSYSEQFFFDRLACTLLALLPFGKSPADLGCYSFSLISCSMLEHQPPMSSNHSEEGKHTDVGDSSS
jgi:hypothetical protein